MAKGIAPRSAPTKLCGLKFCMVPVLRSNLHTVSLRSRKNMPLAPASQNFTASSTVCAGVGKFLVELSLGSNSVKPLSLPYIHSFPLLSAYDCVAPPASRARSFPSQ